MHPTVFRRRAIAVLSASALAWMAGAPASAEGGRDYPAWYQYDVVPLDVAELRLNEAAQSIEQIEDRIVDLDALAEQTVVDRQTLTARDRTLLTALDSAREHASDVIVQAYLAAGDATDADYLLASDAAGDVIWRYELVRQRADVTLEAAADYRELRDEASVDLVELLTLADETRADRRQADLDLFNATLAFERAEVEFTIAEAWARVDAALANSRYGLLPWSELAELRSCESTDNYAAVDPTGTFWGGYQFDHTTWRTVGGQGNPADATPEEQDARALELYARRGAAPWPVCGVSLTD